MMDAPLQELLDKLDADSEDVKVDKNTHYDATKELYDKYEGLKSVDLTWRMARSAFKVAAASEVTKNTDRQKQYLFEAEKWARKGVEMDPKNAESHIWLATICGKLCDFLPTKERIVKGKEVQVHLEEAIKLKPDDFITFYTYGRWCFEIASLSWVERKIASVIFDAPPESSFQDSLDKFTIVKKLRPSWKANIIWMAKCYEKLKDYTKAIETADEAFNIESKDEEDVVFEKDLENIRKKYSSYRAK